LRKGEKKKKKDAIGMHIEIETKECI